MIFVDTSVWVEALRRRESSEAAGLDERSAPIWSLDGDFRRMARLRLVEVYHA